MWGTRCHSICVSNFREQYKGCFYSVRFCQRKSKYSAQIPCGIQNQRSRTGLEKLGFTQYLRTTFTDGNIGLVFKELSELHVAVFIGCGRHTIQSRGLHNWIVQFRNSLTGSKWIVFYCDFMVKIFLSL